jgi:hypothetical protein
MAYNNYFPVGYQPMYYPQQNQVQTPIQAQPQQQPQMNNGIIWVQGEAAAKSYPIAPNSSVPLWDSEANVIYIKSADMSGMPSIKILDYTMRDVAPRSAEIQPQSDFATKDDISILEKEISSLKSKFERMSGGGEKRKEKSDGK